MATTTPNYGWDVPTSTDYVKDGAVAIETLGDDIDASLFSITSGKNVGLVHLVTTSFSASSRVDLLNIFTTSYDNYQIEIDMTSSSGSGNLGFQVGNSGTPFASSSYITAGNYSQFGTNSGAFFTNVLATSGYLGPMNTGNTAKMSFQINSPKLAVKTTASKTMSFNVATNAYAYSLNTVVDSTTSYSDLFIANSTGTITGNIRVYGWRTS